MNNIQRIQEALIRQDLDAILLTDEKNQRYATGFPFTDGAVLVSREKAWLLTDSRYIEAAEKVAGGCAEVRLFDQQKPLLAQIRAALAEAKAEKLGAEEESLSHVRWAGLEKRLGVRLQGAQSILRTLRASKTDEEIQSMIRAQRISEKALEEVLPIIRPGMTEREVMAELVYHMLKNGSEGNSFDPIVVTGKKTSMPHGIPGDEVIREGDFVTMDFGTIVDGYHSDMTRTVAVGHTTDEMRRVYDTVLRAQEAGIALMTPAHSGAEVHNAAAEVIAEAGYGEYFGHGFGHGVGLEIHEAPSASPRNDRLLPVGAVVTAEPGIYLPGRFGVRIEDMILVTETGPTDLTAAPQDLLVI